MSSIDLLSYVGLRRPYDFSKALPFLLDVFFILVTFCMGFTYFLTGDLDPKSPGFWFVCYLLLLFSLSIALLKFPRVSVALLMLGSVEFCLAAVTHIGFVAGVVANDLFPEDKIFVGSPFRYHPLLMGVPRENYRSPFGLDVRHNSNGLRGPEIRISADTFLINVYGGSTTYDIGVANGFTWPEQLEKRLGGVYAVANRGVDGYSTAEHIIQTAFYDDILGVPPKCSVYYIGWNDVSGAHIPNLDSGYADFHFLVQTDAITVRAVPLFPFSPTYRIIARFLSSFLDTIPYAPPYRTLRPGEGSDPRLEAIFLKNVRTLIALNASRGTEIRLYRPALEPG